MTFKAVMVATVPYLQNEAEYKKLGAELVTIPCSTEDELIAALEDADVALTISLPFTRKVISSLKKCRLIHTMGTGYDGIDVQAATDYGICASYTGGYCAEEVAEHTMILILTCARKIVWVDRAVREGKWTSDDSEEILEILSPTSQISGQTLGIIGLGRIGRLVVPKAKGFGMKVISFDPYTPPAAFKESGVEQVDLDSLLRQADYISVNAALTEENRHLLGAEEFKKMKPTTYFINCARAGFVDEKALYNALVNGEIAGAGLDVVEDKALGLDHPLLKLKNVVLTAHCAWYSENSIAAVRGRTYEQLEKVLDGEWPTWFINPEVQEKFRERWGK